jgi:hypothetical protein
MTATSKVELPDALERAATALPGDADSIRPANGDPSQLLRLLDSPAARRVLQWLLENEPGAGDQLASEWAEDPDCDPALLVEIDASSLPKAGRQALRRAHHRLRSRGVAVAEPVAPAVVATIASVNEELEGAALAALDPRGTRIVYVVETNPTGGARIFELVLSGDQGIVGFELYSAARGKARRILREVTTRGERPAVEAPVEAVRALIARALAHQPPNRPPPRGLSEWRSRLTDTSDAGVPPGALARRALEPVEPSGVDRALELIRERELGPWVPDHAALHAAAEQVSELGKSELIVSDTAREEQVAGIVDEASAQIFDEGAAARCAEQFEEMAYVFWKRDREDDARACLAAADAFGSGADAQRSLARAMLDAILEPVMTALDSGKTDSRNENE